MNVNRRTILPTYFGFVSAIALGLTGHLIGGSIAGGDGEFIGSTLGCSWGALTGIRIGVFLTPRSWRTLSFMDYTDPISPAVINMSDGRRLADLANTDFRAMFVILVLGNILVCTRKLSLESEEEEYRVGIENSDPTVDPHPSISIEMGQMIITELKKMARLETVNNSDFLQRQEGDVRVIVSSHQADLHMLFEPTPNGEKAIITFRSNPGTADAAAPVCARFVFLLKARRWFSPRGWPTPRFLREIV